MGAEGESMTVESLLALRDALNDPEVVPVIAFSPHIKNHLLTGDAIDEVMGLGKNEKGFIVPFDMKTAMHQAMVKIMHEQGHEQEFYREYQELRPLLSNDKYIKLMFKEMVSHELRRPRI